MTSPRCRDVRSFVSSQYNMLLLIAGTLAVAAVTMLLDHTDPKITKKRRNCERDLRLGKMGCLTTLKVQSSSRPSPADLPSLCHGKDFYPRDLSCGDTLLSTSWPRQSPQARREGHITSNIPGHPADHYTILHINYNYFLTDITSQVYSEEEIHKIWSS